MTDNRYPPPAMDLPDIDDIDDDLDDATLDLNVDWEFDYETMRFIDRKTGLPVLVDGVLNPEIDFA